MLLPADNLKLLLTSRDAIKLILAVLFFPILAYFISLARRYHNDETATLSGRPKLITPRRVYPRVPFIGHLWGIYQLSSNYFNYLGERHGNLPIYRIGVFGYSVYVVTNLSLAVSMHRQSKQFTMDPFVEWLAATVGGLSSQGKALMKNNKLVARLRARLYPAESMNAIKCAMIQSVAQKLDELADECQQVSSSSSSSSPSTAVQLDDLFQWARRSIIIASTNAVYGPNNPFRTESMRRDFELYERKGLPLVLGVFPRLLGGNGYFARERIVKEFIDFMVKETESEGGTPRSSEMIRQHNKVLLEGGLSIEDVARHNMMFSFAVTTTTNSTVFWLLFRIYSNPALLNDLRAELWPLVHIEETSQRKSFRLEIASLVKSAPLLSSTFHEILRYYNSLPLSRFIRTDTALVDDEGRQFHVQQGRGNMLIVGQTLMHQNERVWGPDAAQFDPYRFVDVVTGEKKLPSGAFQAFGGGDHVCPGRQLAIAELTAFVAGFVLRFDLDSQGLTRAWTEPTRDFGAFFTALLPPVEKIPVAVTQVDKAIGSWSFDTGSAPIRFKLASG